jgi:hypothetical protein
MKKYHYYAVDAFEEVSSTQFLVSLEGYSSAYYLVEPQNIPVFL